MGFMQNFLRGQYSSTVTFILGLLLFFMPFVQLKCKANKPNMEDRISVWQNFPPVTMTGFEMVTGKVQTTQPLETSSQKLYKVSMKSLPFAIIAFLTGIIGFVFSLIDFGGRPIAIVVTATLAAICLVVVRFTFVSNLNPGLYLEKARLEDMIEVKFTVWFYLSVISFILTALSGYFQGLFALDNKYPANYELEI